MAIEVKREQLTNGIPKLTKDRIFPGWEPNNLAQFITINPERCDKESYIHLNAQYTALATRNSDLAAVRDFINALIPVTTSGGTNVAAIINGVSAGVNTVQSVLGKADVPYDITLTVPVELCLIGAQGPPTPEVVFTTLTVKAKGSGSQPNDEDDRAELTLDLNVQGDHNIRRHVCKRDPTSKPDIVTVNDLHYADKNFSAVATISVLALVTGFSLTQAYSAVTVESIELNIKTVARDRWLTQLPSRFLAWMRNEGIELPTAPATESPQPPQ